MKLKMFLSFMVL